MIAGNAQGTMRSVRNSPDPRGTRSNASARTIPTASWPMIDAAVHLIDTPKAFQKLEDPRRSV